MDVLVTHRGEWWELRSLAEPAAVTKFPSRDLAVEMARSIAQPSGGAVYVYDELGNFSSAYAFGSGGTPPGGGKPKD